jgi:hypothetical protein
MGQLSLEGKSPKQAEVERLVTELDTSITAAIRDQRLDPSSMTGLFAKRNKVLGYIYNLPQNQRERLLPLLRNTENNFAYVQNRVSSQNQFLDGLTKAYNFEIHRGPRSPAQIEADRKKIQAELSAAQDATICIRPQMVDKDPPVGSNDNLRLQATRWETLSELKRRQSSDSCKGKVGYNPPEAASQCIRCIYAGVVIKGITGQSNKCAPLRNFRSTAARQAGLDDIWLPSGTNKSCPGEAPVLCNPLVFGIQNNSVVCIEPRSDATKECIRQTGKDQASVLSTKDIMKKNPRDFEALKTDLTSICSGSSEKLCSDVISSRVKTRALQSLCDIVSKNLNEFRTGSGLYARPDPANRDAPKKGTPVKAQR